MWNMSLCITSTITVFGPFDMHMFSRVYSGQGLSVPDLPSAPDAMLVDVALILSIAPKYQSHSPTSVFSCSFPSRPSHDWW